MPEEETYTYEIEFSVETCCQRLEDYGYSDQEWDSLSRQEQDELLDSWIEEFVWENTDPHAKVHKNG